jgi:glycosyltransferase involved in cell wall biosynthesis
MTDIVVFGKYFGYNVGGAELSMFNLLQKRAAEGDAIRVIFVPNITSFGAATEKMALPSSWQVQLLPLVLDWKYFRYWVYSINKRRIKAAFSRLDPNAVLYTYGTFAPAAILAFPGQSVYFARDEMSVGYNDNYQQGIKRLARWCYQTLEGLWFKYWRRDLGQALQKAQVVANSPFIAREIQQVWGVNSTIITPTINTQQLIQEYALCRHTIHTSDKGIVFVGDSLVKGEDLAIRIAAHLPNYRFYFFSRKHLLSKTVGNITYMPWQSRAADIYKYASLVIVPSRWREAFCRVVVESSALEIPVVASRRGAIPETLGNYPENLVDELENLQEWTAKIQAQLDMQELSCVD